MRSVHHIEAPVEKVFDFFVDPRKSVDLFPGTDIHEVKMTKEGTGTYTSYHAKLAGIPFDSFSVYTDVVRNKHITEKSSNALVGTWEYDFEPEGTGTRLTMKHHSRWLWGMFPLSYLNDLAVSRMNEPFVQRVKEYLEASTN
ncbi:MAG TPA: SRPBCC domain-containing protein [Marmoricola sp.]|nr:SRPBCC domain-containing protein [Marmoricola sp.]